MRSTVRTKVQAAVAAGALGALALVPALPASSQQQPLLEVTGQAVCSTAGPVGRYQLDWTVVNNLPAPNGPNSLRDAQGAAIVNDLQIISAVESGAFTGTVTITPNPIPAQSSGTGSDGPVPGSTSGVVTLTVQVSFFDGNATVNEQLTGTITLAGDCTVPTSSSTPSSSTTSTTAAVNNAVTPAFTG